MNLRIDECERLLRDIRRTRGGLSREQETQCRLLEASLARARGDLPGSERLLEALRASREPGGAEPFQLPLQQGLNAYLRCDYTTALDRFLVAHRLSGGPLEKGYALSNVLLCLESLGLSSDEVWQELEGLARGPLGGGELPGLETTLRSYELRRRFRAGELASALEPSPAEARVMQEQYYQLWVSELPFHAGARAQGRLRERLYLADPSFHLKSYRLRTLQMELREEDLREFKVTELCDRVYLWVWKWLSDPARCPVDRIVSLLSGLDFAALAPKLAAEDFQQLRNALLWLGLFDPPGLSSVARIIEGLQIPHVRDFPLFALEKAVLDYLAAVKDGRESAGAALTVDLTTWVVRAGRKRVISEPVCQGFWLLRQRSGASFAELLEAAFGLPRFDAGVHGPKIFNLLSRMKQVAPRGLVFKTKNGRIYSQGSWDGVSFVQRPEGASRRGLSRLGWSGVMRSKAAELPASGGSARRWLTPAAAMQRLQGKSEISRQDLERLMGMSRSTACRVLARWVADGWVTPVGKAKRARYVFQKKGSQT